MKSFLKSTSKTEKRAKIKCNDGLGKKKKGIKASLKRPLKVQINQRTKIKVIYNSTQRKCVKNKNEQQVGEK